ncbi:G-protein coupled receptor Mth2 isoform X2 [Leptinotarsa decemlineata]|uniref:G-protein coupled receptor Mth2 isoform X2 n=1 Tax=Leptinotarsa decemlineata TaxID=7539 RepID=UPI003D3096D6
MPCQVKMKEYLCILLILSHLTCIWSMPKCCTGRNILNKKCIDGGPTNIVECNVRILLEMNDSKVTYSLDPDGNLVENDEVLAAPHYFCSTTLQKDNSEVLLVCLDEEDLAIESTVRSIDVGLQLVSVLFIILTIWVYLVVPQMLDLQGICIIHSISGLAVAFIALAIINLSGYLSVIPCHLLAFIMYFCFQYAFFWQNVLCFHIWRQVINPRITRSVKSWSIFYHSYGIGGPLFFLVFLIVVNHSNFTFFKDIHPKIAETKCWFESEKGALIYFYGPIIVLLTMNVVLFLWTTLVLWKHSQNSSKTKILKYRLKMYAKLFFIMGITWIFEVMSAVLVNDKYKWIWYFTDALNALVGLIIFLVLVIFRKKVIRSLANRKIFMLLRLPANWREAQDSECEELEEEISLGENDT